MPMKREINKKSLNLQISHFLIILLHGHQYSNQRDLTVRIIFMRTYVTNTVSLTHSSLVLNLVL